MKVFQEEIEEEEDENNASAMSNSSSLRPEESEYRFNFMGGVYFGSVNFHFISWKYNI